MRAYTPRMRDFPSCFGESGVQIADCTSSSSSSSTSIPKSAHNVVTCIYESRLDGQWCDITIGWNRSLMGQCLNISIDTSPIQNLFKLDVKPSLLSKKKGSKTLEANNHRLDVFWDLSSAKFGSSPEPSECFYVAIVYDEEMALLLGDMAQEAYRKSGAKPAIYNSVLVEKIEHLFGKKRYGTEAKFRDNGRSHEVVIEYEPAGRNDLSLRIKIDGRTVVVVGHLMWNFRGNQSILVDGISVEVLWDAYNWFFDSAGGSAVFMFLTPLSADKPVSLSCSQQVYGGAQRPGFSLLLYASKSE